MYRRLLLDMNGNWRLGLGSLWRICSMNPLRLAFMMVLGAHLLAVGPAFAQAAPSSPTVAPPAAPHDRTLAAASLARAKLADMRLLARAGPSADFYLAVEAYEVAHRGLLFRTWAEAEADPEVVRLSTRYDEAYSTYRRLASAPDTEAVDFANAEHARQVAGEARYAALQARNAAILKELEKAGGPLPTGEAFVMSLGDGFTYIRPQVGAVFGVEDARWPEAPWQVELQWIAVDAQGKPYPATDLHACGGALIRREWVLTAAHCVWDRKAKAVLTGLRVRAGSGDLTGPMQTFQIRETRLPPASMAYVPSTATAPARNDIALLRIAPAAGLADPSRLRTVKLAPPDPTSEWQGLTVSGWGATVRQTLEDQNQRAAQGGRLRMSPDLRVAGLRPIGEADCARKIRDRIYGSESGQPVAPLAEGVMCAGSQWSGTCQGDSGGPLVGHGDPAPIPANARNRPVEPDDGTRLIGLVSWGVGCQDFTVFTKVWAYKGWIESVVGRSS